MDTTLIDPTDPQYALSPDGGLLRRVLVPFNGVNIDTGYLPHTIEGNT